MKTLHLITLCAMATAMLSVTSCNDDNNETDTVYRYNFNNCYAAVTDTRSDNALTLSMPVTLVMDANWTTGRADLNITGLKIGSSVYPSMLIQQLPWGAGSDKDWNQVRSTLTSATLPTGSAQVSDFRLDWSDRFDLGQALSGIDAQYTPAVSFSYTIDNRYKVAGAIQPLRLSGQTVSTPQGGESYTSNVSLYTFTLDFEKKTASLKINKAAFAERMPLLDMEFSGLPFTVDGDANVTIDCDSFTPSMGGVPMPDYPITGFHAYISPAGSRGTINFVCNFRGVPYTVSATVDFTSMSGFINAEV